MLCPSCQENLEKAIFYGVEIDYCLKCLGLWFEEDELRLAKDKKDEGLNWLDIDLWKYKKQFKISRNRKLCPFCRLPLYEVNYGESPVRQAQGDAEYVEASDIKIDLCNLCYGTWLDRGEFKKAIEYLKKRKDYEIFNNFTRNLVKGFWEIFNGPESVKEEFSDFLTLLKILNYRFAVRHQFIIGLISRLPK